MKTLNFNRFVILALGLSGLLLSFQNCSPKNFNETGSGSKFENSDNVAKFENENAFYQSLSSTAAVSSSKGAGAIPMDARVRDTFRKKAAKITRVTANSLSKQRALSAAKSSTTSRPASSDNSASVFFPPIGNQSFNSCVGWAVGYYYTSYTFARAKNTPIKSNGAVRRDLICSPSFLYPQANMGIDGGTFLPPVMDLTNKIGCADLSTWPIQSDYLKWPSLQARVKALKMKNGALKYFEIPADFSLRPPVLEAMKQHLANGELATIVMPLHPNFDSYSGDGISQGVFFAPVGPSHGGHAVTLVGFDDNKEYLVQGQVRKGAFLFANSWGNSWGVTNTATERGYFWLSYDLILNTDFIFPEIVFTDATPPPAPTIYAAIYASGPSRYETDYGAGFADIPNSVTTFWPEAREQLPVINRDYSYNPQPIGVDTPVIVDLSAYAQSASQSLVVGIRSSSSYGPSFLERVTVYDDRDRDGQWKEWSLLANHLGTSPYAAVNVNLTTTETTNQPQCTAAFQGTSVSWSIQNASTMTFSCQRSDGSVFASGTVPGLTGSANLGSDVLVGDSCTVTLNNGAASCHTQPVQQPTVSCSISLNTTTMSLSYSTVGATYIDAKGFSPIGAQVGEQLVTLTSASGQVSAAGLPNGGYITAMVTSKVTGLKSPCYVGGCTGGDCARLTYKITTISK